MATFKILSSFTVGLILLSFSPVAQSVPIAFDFLPNCDFGQLKLSESQNKKLRSIRIEYKKEIQRISEGRVQKNRNSRLVLEKLLSPSHFNSTQAQNYLEEQNKEYLNFAITELEIQHKIYQLLTPQQQKRWLEICVR